MVLVGSEGESVVMAKRLTKSQGAALFWLFLIVLVIGGIAKFVEAVGPVMLSIGAIVVISVTVLYKNKARRERVEYLMSKYNDEAIVSKIMDGYFWEGQTSEQLIESLGRPVEIDEKMLKTKTKEIWKYSSLGGNRFGLRITLENGVVVGWDKKAS